MSAEETIKKLTDELNRSIEKQAILKNACETYWLTLIGAKKQLVNGNASVALAEIAFTVGVIPFLEVKKKVNDPN